MCIKKLPEQSLARKSVYLRKSYDFETWQKGSQAWWLNVLTSENFATMITLSSQ